MQQPMVQSDQLGNQQQIAQQMMLCPVRVVYETQILIPPGEQIQPNQTIFINPQNPPPWVQNRLQNQVLYVQQMPNIVSPIQQNIDQNQVYLQQNYSYQIPQMMTQERPMQIQNNFQNIGTNIGNSNERLYMANIGQIQNQMKQNVPVINNQIDMQRFLRPQVNQTYRPQVMINPTQNIQNMPQINNVQNTQTSNPANVPSSNINMNVVQNISMSNANAAMSNANIGQIQPRLQPTPNIRPVQQTAKATNTVADNAVNVSNVAANTQNRLPIQATKVGNMVFEHSVNNGVNNMQRVQQHTYRPIQPRPQYRPNIPNVQPVVPVQNLPYYNQKPNQIQNYNVANNRKRKSESPDESKKKMVAFESNVQTPNIINIKTSTEIGVNTSPVHKIDARLQNNVPQFKMADNISQMVVNEMFSPKNNPEIIKHLTSNTIMGTDKTENEKLVRNTVFTQARGRLLNDKEIKINESPTAQIATGPINPVTIKEESRLLPNANTIIHNEGTNYQNAMNISNNVRNMPIIETTTSTSDAKILVDKQTHPSDRIIQSIIHRESLNMKIENNIKINIDKPNLIPSNDIPNSVHDNKNPQNKDVLNDNGKINTSDNITSENKQDFKVEDSNTKLANNDRQNKLIAATNIPVNKPENKSHNAHKQDINKNNSNVEKSIEDDKTYLNIRTANNDNIKLKACKVQLNSNEVQLSAGQLKQTQLDNNKLDNDDKVSDDDKFKSEDVKDSDNKIKDELLDKIQFKQGYDQDILTHVLDGYVIQESNVAFPIRKPINEKAMYNKKTDKDTKDKSETRTPIDLPLLPFYYMHLNNEKVKVENEKVNDENEKSVKCEMKKEKIEEDVVKKYEIGHPFSNLQQSTVKTWTVDELIKHLYSQDWTETASILQEHEIDGESLFLVSKSQLLQIGVSEEHSDVICDFVHS